MLMRDKLGLSASDDEAADETLISHLLVLLEQQQLDYSRFMRGLVYWLQGEDWQPWLVQHAEDKSVSAWLDDYRHRLNQLDDGLDDSQRASRMQRLNPKYILRNHLAQQAIEDAEQGCSAELDRLLQLLQRPFDEQPQWQRYADHRPAWAEQLKVSCSS